MAPNAPFPGSGLADPANIVLAENARFTVLGPTLIRLEWSASKAFEDRPSFFAVQRNAAPQEFKQGSAAGALQIQTPCLILRYRADGQPFNVNNLSITVTPEDGAPAIEWKPGLASKGNLGGSLRTLDEIDGPVPLGEGVLSRDGWYLRDDSATVLYTDEAEPWVAPRRAGGDKDLYFFGYGHDLQAGLRDFVKIGGAIPLPPKFSLGSWYSRYWPYTSDEFLEIAAEYKRQGFPLDVMVLDMDWHKDGWTGYSWNKQLIPDPQGLLKKLHDQGLRVTMNLHPHDGVAAHEDAYPGFAKAMGLDPAKGERVPFDVTSKAFVANYFKQLLHPLEADGVDFWWMDWQQGSATAIPGLDPLMWLNHLHFRDRQRASNAALDVPGSPARRGLAFSRWAGWGDHRHPVHFSGDTHANWEMLDFLGHFTATSGNVGVSFWSHDLGGHFSSGGRIDPELYLRWIQFGALSPVMRVHSTRDPLNDRRPWLYSEEFTAGARKAYALRAALVPYLYTASREAFDDGLGLLRPMYLQYPKAEEAYQVPGQFMVGQDLIMAPAARAGFGPQKVVHVRAWLPEGDWYLWDTHERFSGPLETVVPVPLDGVALFVRGGAAIPLNAPGSPQACASNGPLQVRVYPGAAASRGLYEDDGESIAYQAGAFRRTALSTRPLPGHGLAFSVAASQGSFQGANAQGPDLALQATPWLHAAPVERGGEAILKPVVDAPVSDLYNEMLGDSARVALAALQLDAALPQRAEAQALAARHQKLLGDFRAHAPVAALRKDSLDLQDAYDSLMFSLGDLGPAGEAAFRVLAGVSFFAQVVNDADKGYRLQLELRRDASAVQATKGPAQARWRWDKTALGQHAPFELGRACVSEWSTAVDIDRASLALIKGEAEIEIELRGRRCVLREPFFWDGRTVKDWAIKGPLPLSTQLDASAVDLRGWGLHAFNPSRVARGLRHFYDFGKLFHCPDGACYAASVVEAESAGEAAFSFHQEGQAQVWVNGEPCYVAGTPRFTVALKPGPNQVLIRIADFRNEHGRGPSLSVEAAEGSRVGALRFKAPVTDKALTSKQP
jgi:hypothetical protein